MERGGFLPRSAVPGSHMSIEMARLMRTQLTRNLPPDARQDILVCSTCKSNHACLVVHKGDITGSRAVRLNTQPACRSLMN
jgi:hypothetical protein